MRKHNCSKGFVAIAFGAGLFLAYCFPSKFIIIALAAALVAIGFVLLRT